MTPFFTCLDSTIMESPIQNTDGTASGSPRADCQRIGHLRVIRRGRLGRRRQAPEGDKNGLAFRNVPESN